MTWASFFRHAAHPEAFPDERVLRGLMEPLSDPRGHYGSLDELVTAAQAWHSRESMQYARLFRESTEREVEHLLLRRLLIASAPMGAVLGCCLQRMSAPEMFEDPVRLRLLALLATDMGVGRAEASRSDTFRALLKRCGLHELAVGPHELTFAPAIPDAAFAMPGVLLAVSRRSDLWEPELCGMDFVLRTAGLFPCWVPLQARFADWVDWRRLDPAQSYDDTMVEAPLAVARAAVDHLCTLGESSHRRAYAGAEWMLAALQGWSRFLLQHTSESLEPHRSMATLIRARARDAQLYHGSYRIEGCPLSEHFKAAIDDPNPLMAALAQSSVICPGNSAMSPLVSSLIGPRGKMFRIFTADEVATIRRWIDALPRQPAAPLSARAVEAAPPVDLIRLEAPDEERLHLPLREAYFLLQGRTLAPPLRRFAIAFVQTWMANAAAALDAQPASGQPQRGLPRTWPEEGLRAWLTRQHAQAHQQFQESAHAPLPAREAVIDSSLQLAPLLCIDGAWLQGFTDIRLGSSQTGFSLFEIYWDELGNGQYELNHPRIYRELLREMGIELPPTGSREFARDGRLREESFRLPVLWLCLGKLPVTFLPEILGLNLAMELSGVGGGYRSAHRFLRHHGFSTHFVDLHNTIDNIATGHSAWAARAVDCHMRGQSQTLAEADLATQWRRVGVGFEALTTLPAAPRNWLTRLRRALLIRRTSGHSTCQN